MRLIINYSIRHNFLTFAHETEKKTRMRKQIASAEYPMRSENVERARSSNSTCSPHYLLLYLFFSYKFVSDGSLVATHRHTPTTDIITHHGGNGSESANRLPFVNKALRKDENLTTNEITSKRILRNTCSFTVRQAFSFKSNRKFFVFFLAKKKEVLFSGSAVAATIRCEESGTEQNRWP